MGKLDRQNANLSMMPSTQSVTEIESLNNLSNKSKAQQLEGAQTARQMGGGGGGGEIAAKMARKAKKKLKKKLRKLKAKKKAKKQAKQRPTAQGWRYAKMVQASDWFGGCALKTTGKR